MQIAFVSNRPARCLLVVSPEGVVKSFLVVEVEDAAALLSLRPLRQLDGETLQR